MKRVLLALIFVFAFHSTAFATWSIIALDRSTGQVIIASATCVPQAGFPGRPSRDLMDIQAVIVPGVGVAACQATFDGIQGCCNSAISIGFGQICRIGNLSSQFCAIHVLPSYK